MLLTGATLGCAGGGSSWPGSMFAKDRPTPPQIDRSLAESDYAPAKSKSSFNSLTDNPISNAVSATFEKGVDALTPAPKFESTHDSLSLANKTKPNADLYVTMARMQEGAGDFAQAATLYRKALTYDAKSLDALVGLAHLRDRQDQLEQATKQYEQALRHHENIASLHNDLGLCFARRGMLEQSVKSLNRAIEIEPTKALYRNNVATVLTELNRTDEAYRHLAAAHGPAKAHYNLGYLLHQRGDEQGAASHFAQALDADPSMQSAQAWLARLSPPVQAGPSTVEQPRVTRQPRITQQPRVSLRAPAAQQPSYDDQAVIPPAPRYVTPTAAPSQPRYPELEQPAVTYPTEQSNQPAATPPSPGAVDYYQAANAPLALPQVSPGQVAVQ
jgi:Tfp pilus assembly protein PilF